MQDLIAHIDEAWGRLRHDPDALEAYLVNLLDDVEREYGEASPQFVSVANELGSFYRIVARYEKGEATFARALASIEQLAGRGDAYATCLDNLAELYRLEGDNDKAEKTLGQAEEYFSDKHSMEYAACLNYKGHVASAKGEFSQAKEFYASGLAIARTYPERDFEIEAAYGNIASACEALGQLDEANDLLSRARELYENGTLSKGAHFVALLNTMAQLAERLEDFEAAKALYEEELDALGSIPTSPVDAAVSLANAGDFFFAQNDLASAEQIAQRIRKIADIAQLAKDPIVARALARSRTWTNAG